MWTEENHKLEKDIFNNRGLKHFNFKSNLVIASSRFNRQSYGLLFNTYTARLWMRL